VNDWGYLDTLGAWDGAAGLPEQLTHALENAQHSFRSRGGLAGPASTRAVVAFAQGTAATACEAAAACTASRLAVPFAVVRGTEVPAYVDAHTLAFAVSVTGEAEEVLATGAEAVARGAFLVSVGAGDAESSLSRLASESGPAAAWCPLGPIGAPRAGLGPATVTVLAALAESGLVPDPAPSVWAAAAALTRRRDGWMSRGAAPEELARRLGRTIPLVYGADGVAAVAARWWKAGVNRNAKAPAFAASLPSLTYDELAGWGQSGDVTRQTMSLVFLRHAGEPASAGPLFEAVRAATDEIMANLFEVRAEGEDDLGRFLDLAFLGELVSLHLAGREGADPGPAPAVEESHAAGATPARAR
jgi:hypothetical protein